MNRSVLKYVLFSLVLLSICIQSSHQQFSYSANWGKRAEGARGSRVESAFRNAIMNPHKMINEKDLEYLVFTLCNSKKTKMDKNLNGLCEEVFSLIVKEEEGREE